MSAAADAGFDSLLMPPRFYSPSQSGYDPVNSIEGMDQMAKAKAKAKDKGSAHRIGHVSAPLRGFPVVVAAPDDDDAPAQPAVPTAPPPGP